MQDKHFRLIADKVAEALASQNITEQKVSNDNSNEKVALFTGESMAYSIVYYFDKKQILMRSCGMTDEGPDNDWHILAKWMFDDENDGTKEAESISNDFVDAVSGTAAVKRMKTTKAKRKKSEDEGNADPIFLAKRFVSLFPELKEDIKEEDEFYYPFRGVTFTRAKIVPKVNEYVKTASKSQLEKLGQLLSTQYGNGNADTRSIITIVILNSIPMENFEAVDEYLSDDLKKAWKGARRFIGKKVKPEKPKKKKKSMAQRLTESGN